MDSFAAGYDLDVVGALEGTDKSSSISWGWDYLRHYQSIFAPWRNEPINLIEIGVEHGPSLNVWHSYFPRAQIIGIDINPACSRLAGDRVSIEIGSQEDPGFLHSVCAKYPPTIIIDDGSHLAHHIVFSFKYLFPMLLPGGVYVVEDMEFQFGKWGDHWLGTKEVSAPDYFLDLARARMAHKSAEQGLWGEQLHIRENTDIVTFFGSAVAIHKRKRRDMSSALAFADRYLESKQITSVHLLRLAEYIMSHNGDYDRAERAIRDAVGMDGPNVETLRLLMKLLVSQGRYEEAWQTALAATELRPDDHSGWGWLGQVERNRGRIDEAIAALTRAIALNPGIRHYHEELEYMLKERSKA